MTPSLPALPPRYRDVRYVAEGAFGQVFRAVDDQGREVAIKTLAAALVGRPEVVWRFTGEYRRLAALHHPAFPAAIEEGLTLDGRPFFAMAFLPGTPAGAEAPLPAGRAKAVLAKLADALARLHGQGLVHGDLKADNVLVDGDAVYLLDIGSAAPIGARREAVEGTVEYMAPEVLRQADVAPEADWYALGVLGYVLLAGRTPFVAGPDGPGGLARAQLLQAPPALPAGTDPRLAEAVMALLAKDPGVRAAAVAPAFAAFGLAAPAASDALRGGVWLPRETVAMAWENLQGPDAPAVLALEGEPGTGRSQALDAMRLEARLEGRPWIAAACGGTGEAPGSLARLVVRQAIAAADLPPTDAVEAWLEGRIPAAWLDLEPRARKLSLFGALGEAWVAATGVLGDLIVGLDDWHLADAASRELLDHLRGLAAASRVRWCLAGTHGSAPEGADVVMLADWRLKDLLALAASRLGAPAPETLAEALGAVEPRRPGLVNALLEHWHANGALARVDGAWRFDPAAAGPAGADPWARLWEEKLAGLEPNALAAARLAALAAEAGALPPGALGRTLGLSAAETQEAMDVLLARGILVSVAAGVRLAAAPIAAQLVADLPEERRRAQAATLARLLIDEEPDVAGAPSDEVLKALPLGPLVAAARVAALGGDDELAVALAGVAAARALEHMALDDALVLLAGARDRLTDAVPPARRIGMYLVGGEAARLSDRQDEASTSFANALELAEAEQAPAAAGQALLGLAKARQLRGAYQEALDFAARAEQAAEQAGLAALAARAATIRARVELFMGAGHRAALASCARAVALATQANAPTMRSAALNLQGVLMVQDDPNAREAGLAMVREAIALADGVGDLVGMAAALENLGNAHFSLGELREAREAFQRDTDHCRSYGIGTEGLTAEMNLALVLAELGEAEAGDRAREVAARGEQIGRPFVRAIALAVGGQAASRAGRLDEAVDALDQALDLALRVKNRFAEEYIRLYRLEAELARGDVDGAREQAAAAADLLAQTDHQEGRDRLAVLGAELARLEGDPERALAVAAPYAEGPNAVLAQHAHMVLGQVHLAAGRLAEAHTHFGRADTIARNWRAPWHVAAARLGLARASADPDEAVAQAREALGAGANVFAAAGAGALLISLGHGDAAAHEALAALEAALASLPAPERARLLAAQGLPDATALAELRSRAQSAPSAFAWLGELAAWHDAILAAEGEAGVHQTLLSACSALARADRGYLLGYERGRLIEVVTQGLDYAEEVADGFSNSIAEEVLFSGEPIYLIDASADERWREAASVQSLGLRTVIALPYGTQRQILGVVYLDRAAIDPVIGPDDLTAFGMLTGAAAARVTAMRLAAQTAVTLRGLEAVADAAVAMARAATPAQRSRALVDAAIALTGAERAFWLSREDDRSPWRALAGRDSAGRDVGYGAEVISQSVLHRAVSSREALCLVEADRSDDWNPGQSVLALGLRMVWCLPAGEAGTRALYVDSTRLDTIDPRGLLSQLEVLVERLGDATS
ncbi:MAG: two component, sigma54 specific, transcriptional regulator, Fis family [Cyanobacteria bacterium RYN_339]|nr:two component, sigma54 specific, transcriptional regulator, Fis family [Cyanobacteria bacterium RYN_339]